MPLKFCLPPAEAEKFKNDVASGAISPEALADMTSAERRAFFATRFGEALAEPMNTAIEETLLLKNQRIGLSNWARRMGGGEKSTVKRDIIAKINGMNKLLTPKDKDSFLADLVAHRLGTRISYEEAQKIADLSAKVEETKEQMAAGGDRQEYGRAVIALQNYVGELKRDAQNPQPQDWKDHRIKTLARESKRVLGSIQGNAKSILSSFDNSALLRQGLVTLITHPVVWQKNARQSFVDLVKAFGSKTVTDEMLAEIVSRPTYDLMRQARVDVGVREEAFPESWAERIPYIGAPFRASEAAYRGFQSRTRADLFDLLLKIHQKSGLDLDKEQLLGIGTLVNGMTGRGHLGTKGEMAAPLLNSLFFSPRNMASKVHILTAHLLDPTATAFARKQAAFNLAKILAAFAVTFVIAKALNPKFTLNPNNPTFGKASHKIKTQADVLMFAILDGLGMSVNTYKHEPTTVDLTGSMASYVTLGTRIGGRLARATRSMFGGHVPKEERNTWDDIRNFMENKSAPGVQTVKAIMRDRTFNGQKPTVGTILQDLAVPMPVQGVIQSEQELQRNSGREYVTPFGRTSSR